MAVSDQIPEGVAPSGGKKRLLFGLLAAVFLGVGGFYVVFSGLVGGKSATEDHEESDEHAAVDPLPDIEFIPLDSMVVSLGKDAANKHLLFTAQLEVSERYAEEVKHLLPRILDVLNGYLRAVKFEDIENPASLVRLRAQMLRRVQVVTGEGRVRDLLITEFVLN